MNVETLKIETETYQYREDAEGEVYDACSKVGFYLEVPRISFVNLTEKITTVKLCALKNNAEFTWYYTKNIKPYELPHYVESNENPWIYFDKFDQNILFSDVKTEKMYIIKLNDFDDYYCVLKYGKKGFPERSTGTFKLIDETLKTECVI